MRDSIPSENEDIREPELPVDSPKLRRLPPLLRQAWYGLNLAFRRKISHLGVTPDQFTVMRWLVENAEQGMTQRQIAQAMSSDPNTVASLLERMERSGWISRKRDPEDRRANRIRLKSKGFECYEAIRSEAIELQTQIMEALDNDEKETFLHCLDRIADACREAADSLPRGKAAGDNEALDVES